MNEIVQVHLLGAQQKTGPFLTFPDGGHCPNTAPSCLFASTGQSYSFFFILFAMEGTEWPSSPVSIWRLVLLGSRILCPLPTSLEHEEGMGKAL